MSNGVMPTNGSSEHSRTHAPSQLYLSTRGEDSHLSFEEAVLKGLAQDGGLYIPEEIPTASQWQQWCHYGFARLAFEILSLYISPAEIPPHDLRDIVDRSYATFRHDDVTPLVPLKDDNLFLLELFHGPTFAFKDVALQFLGHLFEYFLARKNEGKTGRDRYHLTVVGATSGDTGSAAIYGLRGKKDVSIFMLHPKGRVSPIQELQMTTVLDPNVYNLAVAGDFDNCQDIVKTLFADADTNSTLKLGAVNSINWARILAQIVYYFHAYFNLVKTGSIQLGDNVRFSTPTGNFGDVLAGYFALRMGLPVDKLIVATNENDILDRFFKTGMYQKKQAQGSGANGGRVTDGVKAHEEEGVKETLSPAMDILVSSNFERLLWFLAYQYAATAGMDDEWNRKQAGQEVSTWLRNLKQKGGFGPVPQDLLDAARATFMSERVTDQETLDTIRQFHEDAKYILDPHTAVGVEAALRSLRQKAGPTRMPHIALSTAHPAKFAAAVTLALQHDASWNFDEHVMPKQFRELQSKEKRVAEVENEWTAVRALVKSKVQEEMARHDDG